MESSQKNCLSGANETSIVMAVRPDLVDFGQVKEDESNLIGIAGRHPVRDSSAAFGNEILEYTMKTLISGIEKEYTEIKNRQNLKNLHWLTKPMEIFYFLKQYLRIGSVKDIIMKSQFLQNGLHIFPIIIYIKFIAVSPDI